MITRDVAQIRSVVGFNQGIAVATATDSAGPGVTRAQYSVIDASCGSLNGDSTANLIAGLIIDRLGLGRGYNSLGVAGAANADIGTTTKDSAFGALSVWLFHSSTTCAADFDRFSSESEKGRQALFQLNTTSTLAGGLMATACTTSTGSATGYFSATATGGAKASYDAFYSLGAAQRYIQPMVLVEAYASSSGGTVFTNVGVSLLFGEPDEAPGPTTSTGRIYVTT